MSINVKIIDRCLMLWSIVFVILQVVFSNQLVDHAQKVDELDQSKRQLAEENEILTHELATHTSLQSIEDKAQSMGLIKATHIVSVTPETYTVALSNK